jgi:hypothetical protein
VPLERTTVAGNEWPAEDKSKQNVEGKLALWWKGAKTGAGNLGLVSSCHIRSTQTLGTLSGTSVADGYTEQTAAM